MTVLNYGLSFLCAIAVLVVVHELGHYLVARWVGIKVLRFSLGFGRIIWSREVGSDRTEWALATIPLGGYVKMLDEREGPVAKEELHRAFNRQSLLRRSLVVLAGPLANLLLAILIYWGLAVAGSREFPPVAGRVVVGTPAAEAGLREGDRILRANANGVASWAQFKWHALDNALDHSPLILDVERGGVTVSGLSVRLEGVEIDERAPDVMQQIGVLPVMPRFSPVIGAIVPGSAAERAGFAVGDRIHRVGTAEIRYWDEFVAEISAAPGRASQVDVDRAGKRITFTVVPEPVPGNPSRGRIGVQVRPDEAAFYAATVEVSYDLPSGLMRAVQRTWETASFSLRVMWRMVVGQVSLRNVSGPVTIADYAGQSASMGLEAYLTFLALVSISIGVLNLLPVPILDGGHLLYYAIEALRGKPLPERFEEYGQKVGLVFLVGLMSLAFFNDFNRIFFG